jgi:succinyl-diaminopimelate desuccinylase
LLGILVHVDVVPEGDGWTSDPFAAEIRDGKILARGALDDKGPTMAAYYAIIGLRTSNL